MTIRHGRKSCGCPTGTNCVHGRFDMDWRRKKTKKKPDFTDVAPARREEVTFMQNGWRLKARQATMDDVRGGWVGLCNLLLPGYYAMGPWVVVEARDER